MCQGLLKLAQLYVLINAARIVTAVRLSYTNLTILEDPHETQYLHCTLQYHDSTTSWAFVSRDTGITTQIGTCSSDRLPAPGCDAPSWPNVELKLEVRRQSYLRFSGVTLNMTGTFVCSEHRADGAVDTASCTVQVVSVLLSGCHERAENQAFTLKCMLAQRTDHVTWTLETPSGQLVKLGTCDGASNCTSPLSSSVAVQLSSNQRISRLTYASMTRDLAGTVVCSNGTESASCSLDVVHNAEVDRCTVRAARESWTVAGWCNVTRVYSALGNYGFYISQYWEYPGWKAGDNRVASRVFEGTRPFTPTAYTDSTSGKVFFSGDYSHSWPLPTLDGEYFYDMITLPGPFGGQDADSTVVVETPHGPSVHCEGATSESESVRCVCSVTSLGKPEGRLLWLAGDTVMAVGQYGVTSLPFPADSGVGADGELVITCQLDWAIKQNVTITVNTACLSSQTSGTESVTKQNHLQLFVTLLALRRLLSR